jgi:hypothetical protein
MLRVFQAQTTYKCKLDMLVTHCCCCVLLQMLWIHGQITPWATMRDLVLPSLVCTGVPVAGMCASMPELQGPVTPAVASPQHSQPQQQPDSSHEPAAAAPDDTGQADASPAAAHVAAAAELPKAGGLQLEASNRDVLVLSVGVGALLFVPVFKYLTGLPPYMGMLSGLAVLWLVTDALHFGENKQYPRVQDALRNVDIGALRPACWCLSVGCNGYMHMGSRQVIEV